MGISPLYNARTMDDANTPPLSAEEAIAIIGVGLIGGSIAAALKKRGFAGRIIGVGRNDSRLENAKAAGLIDKYSTNLAESAAQSDLIIFCTPVNLIVAGVREIASACRPGTLITDAGSTKGNICRELSGELSGEVTFIGSHPLAGSEKQGFEEADPDLFQNGICVVTPNDTTPADQLSRLNTFWDSLGCRMIKMTAETHDQTLARTSHLPHVVAAALVSVLETSHKQFTSSGFCDTTRIAAGDPDLWTSILLANAGEVIQSIDELNDKLAQFSDAIANRDATTLKNLLQLAKTNRDNLGS
jgi:prephenate dehydrogenase